MNRDFDEKKFAEKLRSSISEILLSDRIPFIAKQKFIDDINTKVAKYFSTITAEDIDTLRDIRSRCSL